MESEAIKELLEHKFNQYNHTDFIENDPICIPHQYRKKEDIEIAAFIAATIAWGNRKSIINNAGKWLAWMDGSPHDFILHYRRRDLKPFSQFVHRTFNGSDCVYFMEALAHLYRNKDGLEAAFSKGITKHRIDIKEAIVNFRKEFLSLNHLARVEKHVSNPEKNSSAKRLCMFLRWMVRDDKRGVDFGIWKKIKPSQLCLPLDVHTGNMSRALGLMHRTQNDWKAVEEITAQLRTMDPKDPVKYDFALFGMGVNRDF